MGWETIALLIAQYGLPLALKLVENWENKNPVTLPEVQNLQKLADQTKLTQMQDALARAGIDPNCDIAKELIALVK